MAQKDLQSRGSKRHFKLTAQKNHPEAPRGLQQAPNVAPRRPRELPARLGRPPRGPPGEPQCQRVL
eukprot:1000715-Pyramimonas_sp.AAC.1